MIKTILVPASGSDTDQRVFATTLSIARPLAAHIEFIHVRLSPSEAAVHTPHVEYCVGSAISSALNDLERKQADQSANALAHVNAFCSAHEIAFRTTPGLPPVGYRGDRGGNRPCRDAAPRTCAPQRPARPGAAPPRGFDALRFDRDAIARKWPPHRDCARITARTVLRHDCGRLAGNPGRRARCPPPCRF